MSRTMSGLNVFIETRNNKLEQVASYHDRKTCRNGLKLNLENDNVTKHYCLVYGGYEITRHVYLDKDTDETLEVTYKDDELQLKFNNSELNMYVGNKIIYGEIFNMTFKTKNGYNCTIKIIPEIYDYETKNYI